MEMDISGHLLLEKNPMFADPSQSLGKNDMKYLIISCFEDEAVNKFKHIVVSCNKDKA